jgi:hypothetical protein
VVSGFITWICLIGFAGVVLVVGSSIDYALQRRRSALYPDAVLVTGLVEILSMVERESTKWTDLDFKRQLMSKIEAIALCIERDLPRRLRTRDVTLDAWLRDRVRQIAAVFRSLKQWVSTPKPDTRGKFVEEIAHRLVCAASGDRDGLSKPDPVQLSAPQLRSRVLVVGRVLLAGALPGLVLWLLHQTRFAPHGDVAQYASVGVFIWAVVSVLSAFDPDFSTKASTVKEMAKTFLPGKKGSD